MLPILRSRFDELERQRRALLDDLLAHSAEQLQYHPEPGVWSLAQLIQHLVLVEEGTLAFLEQKTPRPPSARTLRDRIKWAAFSRVSPLPLRVKTPTELVVPRSDASVESLVQRWNAARARLAAYLERIADHDLPLIVFKHAIGGALPILETLDFISLHMRHHEHQIRRIRAAPGWPAAAPSPTARASV
jgi:hypothetical protein